MKTLVVICVAIWLWKLCTAMDEPRARRRRRTRPPVIPAVEANLERPELFCCTRLTNIKR